MNGSVQLLPGQCQQRRRQGLQCFELGMSDVGLFVLLKTEHEKPFAGFAGGHQCARRAALTSPRQRNALFHYVAAQICIYQSRNHFVDGFAQGGI